MNYADGIYSDLLLVINTSYLSPAPASSASYSYDFSLTVENKLNVENYPISFLFSSHSTLELNVQMGNAFGMITAEYILFPAQ